MPAVENRQIVETPTKARAGATGHNVRYVLAFGTAAAILALLAIAAFAFN